MNIVYLHSHDTGRYLAPYGHAVSTPHLQSLAEQGVTFRQAFAQCPTCSPSRAALLTGQSAHQSGMMGLAHRGFALSQPQRLLPRVLRQNGYETVLAGHQHVFSEADLCAQSSGYNQIRRFGSDQTCNAVEFLGQVDAKTPFFLDVGFYETHREGEGFAVREDAPPVDARYVAPPAPLPDTLATRRDMAEFHRSVRQLDEGVGTVLNALDAAGLRDDTLVFFTTDHGLPFPGMKSNLKDDGLGVSLIARGPQGFNGGQVQDALVSQLDLFPTLCALAHIETPDWCQGHDLGPLVRGEVESVRQELWGETSFHVAYEPARMIRTERWKYIRRFQSGVAPCNTDDSPSKHLWARAGFYDQTPPLHQLYDLWLDPHEARNLAAEAHCQTTRHELAERLENWMRQTHDPLLDGAIEPPAGAPVLPAETYSPRQTPRPL